MVVVVVVVVVAVMAVLVLALVLELLLMLVVCVCIFCCATIVIFQCDGRPKLRVPASIGPVIHLPLRHLV